MSNAKLYEPVLEAFKMRMREKLSHPANVRKSSWRDDGVFEILTRLKDEVQELDAEILDIDATHESIISECVDVANFAMMLADRVKRLA